MSTSLRRAIVLVLAGLAGSQAAASQDSTPTTAPSPVPAQEAALAATATAAAATATAAAAPAPAAEAPAGETADPSPSPTEGVPASSIAPELAAPELPAAPELTAPASADAFAPVVPTLAMTSGELVFSRLRGNLNPNDCDAGSNSALWRERYAGSPSSFSRRLESVLPLIDFVSTEVERAGLPAEFTFIPLVESWYQPGAVGAGGPAGMWQMIPSTARNHGIHIREGYDGRLSPVESTRAALSYLKVLQDMFGDWQAIVMAYNAGEGRMQHAMSRAGSRVTSAADRRPHGLSNITYDYVAKLQALSCLVIQPHRYGVHLPVDTRFEPLVPLLMEPGVHSLGEFASAHGKDPDLLRQLNPGFRNGRIVADVPRLVLAPPGINSAVTETASQSEALAMVATADALPDGATSTAPTSALLAEATPSASSFLVPTSFDPPAAEASAGSASAVAATAAALPAATPSTHRVQSGESLWSIARLYRLPIEQLIRANRLGSKSQVHPGQMLRLVP